MTAWTPTWKAWVKLQWWAHPWLTKNRYYPWYEFPMTTPPWYADGLQFTCTQCGNCCTGEPGHVWVTEDDLRAIAKFLGEPLEVVVGFYSRMAMRGRSLREKSNGDCVFYDRQKGCTIYSVRPPQCRTWPFWQSNVRSPEDWQQTCEICPGSGQGELIPAEEITRRLNVIRL